MLTACMEAAKFRESFFEYESAVQAAKALLLTPRAKEAADLVMSIRPHKALRGKGKKR